MLIDTCSIGATGYIGGDILHAIATSSSLEISCLVRGKDKAAAVSVTFPFVRIVQGDLDDSALIEKESEAADVVLSETSSRAFLYKSTYIAKQTLRVRSILSVPKPLRPA